MKKNWNGRTEENSTEISLIDAENQSLMFMVGDVLRTPNGSNISKVKPGLWIWYQEKNLQSKVQGAVITDEENWKKIRNHINKGFRKANAYYNT